MNIDQKIQQLRNDGDDEFADAIAGLIDSKLNMDTLLAEKLERLREEHAVQIAAHKYAISALTEHQSAGALMDLATFRAAVADALAALRAEFSAAINEAIDSQNVAAASLAIYWRHRLDATIASLDLPEPDTCTWTPDSDGIYDTECDNRFFFDTGTPAENNIAFCGYCGRRLIEGVSE